MLPRTSRSASSSSRSASPTKSSDASQKHPSRIPPPLSPSILPAFSPATARHAGSNASTRSAEQSHHYPLPLVPHQISPTSSFQKLVRRSLSGGIDHQAQHTTRSKISLSPSTSPSRSSGARRPSWRDEAKLRVSGNNIMVKMVGGVVHSKEGALLRKTSTPSPLTSLMSRYRGCYVDLDNGFLSIAPTSDELYSDPPSPRFESYSLQDVRELRLKPAPRDDEFVVKVYGVVASHLPSPAALTPQSPTNGAQTSYTNSFSNSNSLFSVTKLRFKAISSTSAQEWVSAIRSELRNQILVLNQMIDSLMNSGKGANAESLFLNVLHLVLAINGTEMCEEYADALMAWNTWIASSSERESESLSVREHVLSLRSQLMLRNNTPIIVGGFPCVSMFAARIANVDQHQFPFASPTASPRISGSEEAAESHEENDSVNAPASQQLRLEDLAQNESSWHEPNITMCFNFFMQRAERIRSGGDEGSILEEVVRAQNPRRTSRTLFDAPAQGGVEFHRNLAEALKSYYARAALFLSSCVATTRNASEPTLAQAFESLGDAHSVSIDHDTVAVDGGVQVFVLASSEEAELVASAYELIVFENQVSNEKRLRHWLDLFRSKAQDFALRIAVYLKNLRYSQGAAALGTFGVTAKQLSSSSLMSRASSNASLVSLRRRYGLTPNTSVSSDLEDEAFTVGNSAAYPRGSSHYSDEDEAGSLFEEPGEKRVAEAAYLERDDPPKSSQRGGEGPEDNGGPVQGEMDKEEEEEEEDAYFDML